MSRQVKEAEERAQAAVRLTPDDPVAHDVLGMALTGTGKIDAAANAFERALQRAVAALDTRYPQGQELDVDGLAAVIDLSAWAHAEWVRMHPFANGNGRTARIWASAAATPKRLPN